MCQQLKLSLVATGSPAVPIFEGCFVRLYTGDQTDFDAIAALWEQTGLGNPKRGDTKQVVDTCVTLGGAMFLVDAGRGSRCIATAWVTCDGRRMLLHHFGVTPDLQGKGIGSRFLVEILRSIKKSGFQVKLEVGKENKRAIALYTKAGFQSLGEYDVYIVRDISKLNV